MSEQDGLFEKNAAEQTDEKDSSSPAAEEAAAAKDIAGGGIADGEVRAVLEEKPRRGSANLLLGALVVLLLAAAGLLLMDQQPPAPSAPPLASEPAKLPVPERQPVTAPVKEEKISEPAVAAAPAAEPVTAAAPNVPAAETLAPVEAREKAPAAATVAETAQAASEPVRVADPPAAAVASLGPLYTVLVGPLLTKAEADAATSQLRDLGFEPKETRGTGTVTMIRLLEGIYPTDEARARLEKLKGQVSSAFVLPAGDNRALYAGSFHDPQRAKKLTEELAAKKIKVSPVTSQMEMSGRMLIALQADKQTASQVVELIGKSGLQAQMQKN